MPSYEALLIIKKLPKPELAKVLKRAAVNVFNTEGVLFGVENLGSRSLPYAISAHGKRHREGSYFLLKFDAPVASLDLLRDEYRRDIDLIRSGFVKIRRNQDFECTLDEELKPPAYRKDVQEMIEKGRKLDIYKFRPKTGLDYNPFRT